MAISIASTVTLIPFPSRVQVKSLEPDGVAVVQRADAGDASGGNHLLEIRAASSHLYVLKNFSVEADGGSQPGQSELLLRARWASDAAPVDQQHFYQSFAFATVAGLTTRFIPTTGVIQQIQTGARNLILGSFAPLPDASNPIMAISVPNGGASQTLTWTYQFWAYRREAFTIPGTLLSFAGESLR